MLDLIGKQSRRLLICLLFVCPHPASAHDFWINKQKVDPVTKNFCCGENDCKHLSFDEVRVEQYGYRLLDANELISFGRTQPSPDGEFWVCRWGEGTRSGLETKCFFGSPIF